MLNDKIDATIFVRKVLLDMREMKFELNEHRYYLERKVALRTAHLMKRIELLESCNATLCEKLTQTREALAMLKQSPISAPVEVGADTVTKLRLYVMNPMPEAQECAEPHVEAA